MSDGAVTMVSPDSQDFMLGMQVVLLKSTRWTRALELVRQSIEGGVIAELAALVSGTSAWRRFARWLRRKETFTVTAATSSCLTLDRPLSPLASGDVFYPRAQPSTPPSP